MALQRLKEAAERAKIELSSSLETDINLPFITADGSGAKHLQMKLARSKLEKIVEDLVERTLEPCRQALKDAGPFRLRHRRGRSCRRLDTYPSVQQAVTSLFERDPHKGSTPMKSWPSVLRFKPESCRETSKMCFSWT